MQFEAKQINATSKEINLTVEAERVDQAYQKYLVKAAKNIEIPGFRKGKAPLGMVTKLHSDRIREYFEKDFVDEAFSEAARENDIHFLMYPEVKDIQWEQGSEMKIRVEIEHEPLIEFKQLDGLQVPFRPISLDDEVGKFINNLAEEHTSALDVDAAQNKDRVNAELKFDLDGQEHTFNVDFWAGEDLPQRSLPELLGSKTGDSLEIELAGSQIKLLSMNNDLGLDNDSKYPCRLLVNSILRYSKPAIDDEFARDMDFADLVEMRTKIGDDLRLGVEHRNLEGENGAIIGKIYQDSPFPLPQKTLRYIVDEEVQRMDPKYREILYQYYIQSVVQEMTTMYIMNALKKHREIEISPEMREQYIEHRAILDEKNPAAWKEANAAKVAGEDFQDAAKNYFLLRQIASASEFVEPEEEPEESAEHDHQHAADETKPQEEEA